MATDPENSTLEDVAYELKCQPCEYELGELQEVAGLCIDCLEYLCQSCYDGHTRPKPCRNHYLLDREEVAQLESNLTRKCAEHGEELIRFYCVLHEELCCTRCLYLNHHSCSEMCYIPHHARELSYLPDYQRFKQQVDLLVETAGEVSKLSTQNTETLKFSPDDALAYVQEVRKNFADALDRVEAELNKEAESMKTTSREHLAMLDDKYRALHAEVQETKEMIDELQNTNQNASLYIEMLETRDRLRSLVYQMGQAKKEYSEANCKMQFTPNQEFLDRLKLPGMIGTLTWASK